MCCEGTTNPQLRGCKEGLQAYSSSSRRRFQNWKVYALCWWSHVAMLSCHLCMAGWLLRTHSLILNQAAPLPSVQCTEIVVWRPEFVVVGIEWLSAILPKDDTRDSERWDGVTGSKRRSGRSRGWNLRRRLLESVMHLSEDYYRTRYPSYRLSQCAQAFDGLGNILAQTPFQDRQI